MSDSSKTLLGCSGQAGGDFQREGRDAAMPVQQSANASGWGGAGAPSLVQAESPVSQVIPRKPDHLSGLMTLIVPG